MPGFPECFAAYGADHRDTMARFLGSESLYLRFLDMLPQDDNLRKLGAALADGDLQVVATDHALVSLKDRFETMGTTVDAMQAGQAAVELRVPLLYDRGVNSGRFSVERWVELISVNPAKLMGLWPRKSRLEPGADADVVVFDPNRRWTVRWQDLHMKEPYSCWDGWELTGKVRDTILRGRVIVDGERFVGSPGGGEYVPRRLAPEVAAGDVAFTSQALGAAQPERTA